MKICTQPGVFRTDDNITIDDFVGEDIWVKVVDIDGFVFYLNVIRSDIDIDYYYLIPAEIIDEYADMLIEEINDFISMDTMEFIKTYMCYIRSNFRECNFCIDYTGYYIKDHYAVIYPVEIMTTNEILDALEIVKERCRPFVAED